MVQVLLRAAVGCVDVSCVWRPSQVVNTMSALWLEDKSQVTEEQYKDFYKFIANAFDEPLYK
jgi:HSP90 family molecular chaperone